MNSIGFIGGGRIVRVFLSGWKRANCLPSDITVSDSSPAALAKLNRAFPQVNTTADNTLPARHEVVFLALHPPVAKAVLPQLRVGVKTRLLASLAPMLTVEKLSLALGGFASIARLIPNAPSAVGKGFNPVAFGPAVGGDNQTQLLNLLGPLGDCPVVPERDLESYALISGRGPTYFWPQLYELAALARSFGLPANEALQVTEKMVLGALAVMRDGDLSMEEAMDLIPVKPMPEATALAEALRTALPGLLAQMRGATQS